MIGSRDTQRQVIGRTSLQYRTWGGIVNPMLMAVPMQAANAFSVMQVTNTYNMQCRNLLDPLIVSKEISQRTLDMKLAIDPSFTSKYYRGRGVNLAWKYEQAYVAMGGKGTVNWTPEQRIELLQRGKVRDYVGHHQKM